MGVWEGLSPQVLDDLQIMDNNKKVDVTFQT